MTAVASLDGTHGRSATVDLEAVERSLAEDLLSLDGVERATIAIHANAACAIIRTVDGRREAVAIVRTDGETDADAADRLWLKATARILGTAG